MYSAARNAPPLWFWPDLRIGTGPYISVSFRRLFIFAGDWRYANRCFAWLLSSRTVFEVPKSIQVSFDYVEFFSRHWKDAAKVIGDARRRANIQCPVRLNGA